MRQFTIPVLNAASDLVSEEGENPEYDRALVEMSCRMLGLSTDENRTTLAHLIGVKQSDRMMLVLSEKQQEAVGYALARAIESGMTAPDDKAEIKGLLALCFPKWARSVRPS